MINREDIRDRAVRMGIATGEMPEVDFIWTVQKTEGNQPCFGQGAGCRAVNCRWRNQCVALDAYKDHGWTGTDIFLRISQKPSCRKAG